MMTTRSLRAPLAAAILLSLCGSLAYPADIAPQTVAPQTSAPPTDRDGQHDFDWMFGTWKAHLKRLVNPLTGSTTWVEYEGTQVTRKIWGGRANLDEFVADTADKKTHLEGMTVRLYSPETHQWSIYWATSKTGTIAMPPTVGHYTNGRGEFYDEEEFNGRHIVVRYTWSDITATSAHFEQAFSVDGGKTWEPNWISTITRIKE
jgi:hypothetical protein